MLLRVMKEVFVFEADTEPDFEENDSVAARHEAAAISDDLNIGGEFILWD